MAKKKGKAAPSLALRPADRWASSMLAELLTKKSDGVALRTLLESHGLSQRGAARELDISERTMRRYIAGELPVPRVVALALAWLVQTKGTPE